MGGVALRGGHKDVRQLEEVSAKLVSPAHQSSCPFIGRRTDGNRRQNGARRFHVDRGFALKFTETQGVLQDRTCNVATDHRLCSHNVLSNGIQFDEFARKLLHPPKAGAHTHNREPNRLDLCDFLGIYKRFHSTTNLLKMWTLEGLG
jgi:hypothetical protein